MSVDAYITRKNKIWVDEINKTYYDNNDGEGLIEYVHTSEECCINFSTQDHIRDLILEYGGHDYTDEDWNGTIELGLDDFEALYENEYFDDEDDIESIEQMKRYFDEGHYFLIFNCY